MNELPVLETLFVYDDPRGSEERLSALAERPEVLANQAYYCELLTRLARSRGLQRRFDEAHATIDQAEALNCPDAACQVRIPLERGRIFNSSGDKASARPLFLRANELALEAGLDGLAVDAMHMMGIVETGEESLAWNEKAIAFVERSSDRAAKRWLGSLYNNTGWTHHDSGNHERALELFEKALAWRQAQNQEPQVRIARWCVARCLRSLGRYEEALRIQRELHGSGSDDGYVDEELGELYLAMGDGKKAKPHFAEAHRKLSADPWLQANEPERLARLQKLADVEIGAV